MQSDLRDLEDSIAKTLDHGLENCGPNLIVPIPDPMFVMAFGPVYVWESSEVTRNAVADMGARIAKAAGINDSFTVKIIPHSDVNRFLG